MRSARETHLCWAEHFEECVRPTCKQCKAEKKVAGNAKHHRDWVAKYDNVLEILEGI